MDCSPALIVYAKLSMFALNYVTMYHRSASSSVQEQILHASFGMTAHLFSSASLDFLISKKLTLRDMKNTSRSSARQLKSDCILDAVLFGLFSKSTSAILGWVLF